MTSTDAALAHAIARENRDRDLDAWDAEHAEEPPEVEDFTGLDEWWERYAMDRFATGETAVMVA
jgi:hypothetical protein